jgi:hypothetical protein
VSILPFLNEKVIVIAKVNPKLKKVKQLNHKQISDIEFEISIYDCINHFLNENIKVNFVCDKCKREFTYKLFAVGIIYKEIQKTLCKKCKREYHTLQLTNGQYSHTSQMPEVIQKYKNSNLRIRGVENPAQAPEVLQKMKNTCMERYGYEWGIQSDESKENKKETCLKKYGVDNPMKLDYVNKKRIETSKKNYRKFQGASTEQVKIASILNGELEVRKSLYKMDVFVDNIDIEYDGGGHFAFNDNIENVEHRKERFLFNNYGIKTIRFITVHDKLPNDETILDLFNQAKKLLDIYNTVRIYLEENNRFEYY